MRDANTFTSKEQKVKEALKTLKEQQELNLLCKAQFIHYRNVKHYLDGGGNISRYSSGKRGSTYWMHRKIYIRDRKQSVMIEPKDYGYKVSLIGNPQANKDDEPYHTFVVNYGEVLEECIYEEAYSYYDKHFSNKE